MIVNLMVLGFFLSLDNFRTAIILGPLRFRWRRALEIACVFGFFDGLAPLAGILIGHDLSHQISDGIAGPIGATALGLYGVYLIIRALQSSSQEEMEAEHRWSIFGLPLPLSLDNVIAGTGLGMIGLSMLVPAVLFGVITLLMTLAGLQLGGMIARLVPVRARWDVLVGAALVIEALVFGFVLGD